jgi:hypothetical protein
VTLVCCWLDDSYGRHRITAIADSRAAEFWNNEWHPRSNQTLKLFRVPVNCYRTNNFVLEIGSWRNPYFQTEVALGFAGYCFEAMTIISLFSRAMEQLVSQNGEPRPHPEAMAGILARVVADYFVDHTNQQTQRVHFLLFGFSAERPWIAQIGYTPEGLAGPSVQPLPPNQVYAIGDAGDANFTASIEETLDRISKHSRGLHPGSSSDAAFDHNLEQARHRDAAKKAVEEGVLEKLESEFNSTVGGFLQKLEVYPSGDGAVVAYTRESRSDILDNLPPAGPGLCYLPVGEQMGRRRR